MSKAKQIPDHDVLNDRNVKILHERWGQIYQQEHAWVRSLNISEERKEDMRFALDVTVATANIILGRVQFGQVSLKDSRNYFGVLMGTLAHIGFIKMEAKESGISYKPNTGSNEFFPSQEVTHE